MALASPATCGALGSRSIRGSETGREKSGADGLPDVPERERWRR
ncbi:hypothetical protein [Neosynechococcus sphagnicola]|nr:hypothetical protein [Neosynechococcus sphagnicola]